MGRKWRWEAFQGSDYMLGLMKRDIHYVDEAVTYCRGRQACVQAGGNLGIYPKRLASYFRTVYTFEPASDLWPMLLHNAPESNIVKMQAALGDERRLIKVSRERRDGKPNSGGLRTKGGLVSPQENLSSFFDLLRHRLSDCKAAGAKLLDRYSSRN